RTAIVRSRSDAPPSTKVYTLSLHDALPISDGVLFSPERLGQEDVALLDVSYPLVLLGERIFGGPTDHVTMRNVEAARAATEHLRSEEHTSELQSRENLVCRLLL